MALLGIDLGGTKLAAAVFTEDGSLLFKESIPLEGRIGSEVGKLVTGLIRTFIEKADQKGFIIDSIGIAVPGISNRKKGTVWAPNIKGWNEYPLLAEAKEIAGNIPVLIDSDRACYILGEVWKGNARGCKDAVFMSVGTGIGAGILVNGEVLRGSNDIAGAIGWMALTRPFDERYIDCGCFEYHASGDGIARVARDLLSKDSSYTGTFRRVDPESINASDLFNAYETGDPLACEVIDSCIEFWGMAVANVVSLFNPEKIIFGGGVFGPAGKLIPAIRKEAARWAQPVGITQVTLDISGLGGDAGVYGAGYMALKNLQNQLYQNSSHVQ
jgi:glucokinase